MVYRYQYPDHRIRLDYIIQTINRLKIEPRELRVLDLGCGWTPMMDMDFKSYVCVDKNLDAVNQSKFDRSNFTLIHGNYEEPLNLPENQFNLALWNEGPEHTVKHKQVFNNLHRVLAPHSFLLITCPNMYLWTTHSELADHKYSFSYETLIRLVEENNFTVLESAEVNSRINPHQVGYNWLFCLATNGKFDPRYRDAWGNEKNDDV